MGVGWLWDIQHILDHAFCAFLAGQGDFLPLRLEQRRRGTVGLDLCGVVLCRGGDGGGGDAVGGQEVCRLDCKGDVPVSLHDLHPPALAVAVGVGPVSCWAVMWCCCFYAPLRAIEADVRNAPDIVDLNVRYPVESREAIGRREWRGSSVAAVEGKGRCCRHSRPGEERCELRCARNRRLITNLDSLIGWALSGGSKEPRSSKAAARIVHVTTAQRRTLAISHAWCDETTEWTWF